jgi:hypothetical protein
VRNQEQAGYVVGRLVAQRPTGGYSYAELFCFAGMKLRQEMKERHAT